AGSPESSQDPCPMLAQHRKWGPVQLRTCSRWPSLSSVCLLGAPSPSWALTQCLICNGRDAGLQLVSWRSRWPPGVTLPSSSCRIVRFPSTLNQHDTERAIAAAFRMWSDISPLSFQRLPPGQPTDITLGFYTFNHTDCWFSPLHPCFDGLNGELAHAFLPPRGEIHFDNHEFWILGRSRFSWKQGVWLNDLVQVAAHEIGHALGLWHSQDVRALMHPNATYSRTWRVGQDDVWAVRRLYGCVDEKRQCAPWAQRGFCMHRPAFMNRHCPQICNSCFGETLPTPWLPGAGTGAFLGPGVLPFSCSWYKDGALLSHSVPKLRVHATEFSEGQYTCLIHRTGRIIHASSWQIKLKARSPSRHRQPDHQRDVGGNAPG
uniref:ShKT domain-containing protein n=1 Tax=Pelusios castaneus TaxID=367368 RepID=A0A8C8RHU6_9SAUR